MWGDPWRFESSREHFFFFPNFANLVELGFLLPSRTAEGGCLVMFWSENWNKSDFCRNYD
jgi:hypothetical protein